MESFLLKTESGLTTMTEKEYIEREALIEACKKIIQISWNETTAPVSWSHAYADFIDDIEEQPAADVAPVRHGRWVNESFYTYCSVCGNMAIYDKYGQEVESDYCPNCGAKMDGENL